MDEIKRVGPPIPIQVRGAKYDLSVPLNATPSAAWRRIFHAPDEWKEPYHPTRIRVKHRALIFTSEESRVQLWIELIDKWIAAANRKYADSPESTTRGQVERNEEVSERRRLQEVTEKFKDL